MTRHVLGRLIALTVVAVVLTVTAGAAVSFAARSSAPDAQAATLFVAVDMVQGSHNIAPDQADQKSCVLSSRFPRNSELVWRARVFDPKTGDLMDDKALGKVEARLANGQTVAMRYGAHPPRGANQEYYWTGSWVVPKDYPTGTLRYSVVATAADGRTGTWEPFSVAPSLPAITDEVLEDIAN